MQKTQNRSQNAMPCHQAIIFTWRWFQVPISYHITRSQVPIMYSAICYFDKRESPSFHKRPGPIKVCRSIRPFRLQLVAHCQCWFKPSVMISSRVHLSSFHRLKPEVESVIERVEANSLNPRPSWKNQGIVMHQKESSPHLCLF